MTPRPGVHMRVLFIHDTRPHAHDYGTDFLVQGAFALLGAASVFEWPEKPSLHLSVMAGRDECQIDSDAWLPAKGLSADAIADMACAGEFEAIIVTGAYGTWPAYQMVCRDLAPQTPVIGLHYDDQPIDTRAVLEQMVGRPLAAYWHREQAPAHARQLWLSQPRARVRPVDFKVNLRPLFYVGAAHDDPTATPRMAVVASLRHAIPGAEAHVTANQQQGRLAPERYRDRLWESAVSVIWNTSPNFPTWQSNRWAESCALGCAIVAERPPYAPPAIEGVEWIDRPEEAGAAVLRVLSDGQLRQRQRATQRSFLARYTSEAVLAEMLAEVA